MRTLSFLSLSIFTVTSLVFFPINASASAYLLGTGIYIMADGKLEDYKITTTSQKIYERPRSSYFTDVYFIHRQLGWVSGISSGEKLDVTYENLKTSAKCTVKVDSGEEGETYIGKKENYIGSKLIFEGDCYVYARSHSGGSLDFPSEYLQETIYIKIDF